MTERVVFVSSRYVQADKLKGFATLCVLLLLAFLLYRDPFLLLWWPQEPKQVRDNMGLESLWFLYKSL